MHQNNSSITIWEALSVIFLFGVSVPWGLLLRGSVLGGEAWERKVGPWMWGLTIAIVLYWLVRGIFGVNHA